MVLSSYLPGPPFWGLGRFRAPVSVQEAGLLCWNQVYETMRPHQALGYRTPDQFYQDWLKAHPNSKEVLSDMS